ncbi:MAG: hypothetical protein A2Y75_05275 [Candidatus Solincola sediminis]|uniref:Uncharacterized protein n=1 Tax=Candidatus Solincola sediminis TaxID=1797199 RepID=A0A1F2WG38_9ACTN|nr:MAG: hypothetical protein A2Y75_05275 [Candidatus Solincola sediminis]
MKYEIELTTVISMTTIVNADTEDDALDHAYDHALELSSSVITGPWRAVFINDAWEHATPIIKEISS